VLIWALGDKLPVSEMIYYKLFWAVLGLCMFSMALIWRHNYFHNEKNMHEKDIEVEADMIKKEMEIECKHIENESFN
jgi:hypothetical protein